MSGTTFEKLGVRGPILAALAQMAYERPTPVQAAAIPPLLAGRDALVEAQTGSGKTTAFGIPAVVVGSRERGLRVLVLVPTRELARQVADEVRTLATGSPFKGVALTGGLTEEQEEKALFGDVRCVVATPGRLLALMDAGKIRLDKIDLVVLDEADRMLDMGFRTDVEVILKATAHRKQTALFSATLPTGVIRLAEAHLNEPVDVRVGAQHIPESLEHHRLNVFADDKDAALLALLRKEAPERAMVFVRTRGRAVEVVKLLKRAGLAADQLQGDMTHEQRRHVFDLFTRGVTKVLVATDLASRGLDVPEMQLVVNLDLPDDDETYLHRAGRAARMGREGRVVTFVLPNEKPRRERLEQVASVTFTPYKLEYSAADLPQEPSPAARAPPGRPKPGAAAETKPAAPKPRETTRRPPREQAAPREQKPRRDATRAPREAKAPRGREQKPRRDARPRPPPGGRWRDMPKESKGTRSAKGAGRPKRPRRDDDE